MRQARTAKRLTQVELAEAIGVSRVHLTHVENGRGGLALDKLSLLAKETGTTVAWLIGENGPPDPADAELLEAFHAMDDEQKTALLTVAKMAKSVAHREPVKEIDEPGERPKRRAVGCDVPVVRMPRRQGG